nr:immunoglobulin light chain junction region [Macaca mulatta]
CSLHMGSGTGLF